jgi:CubicO group peptidase (beta-lactamase class C family)
MSLEIDRGAAGLQHAASLVAGWVDSGVLPGAALVVARGDTVIAEGYWGFAELASRRPAGPDTLWSIASITKPITAATVMSSVEKGLVSLDAPIVEALPEFGSDAPRGDVTLRHLLTHTSGLAGFSVDNLELRKQHRAIEDFIASFLREQLHFTPGRWHLYSSVGFGLAAEISGRALIAAGDAPQGLSAVRAHEAALLDLLARLGVTDVALRPDEDQQRRCVWVESTGQEGLDWEIGNSRYYRSLGMPWGGLFMTARGVMTVMQAFLSRSASDEMTRLQVAPPEAPLAIAPTQRDVTWDPNSKPRARVPWGLGWEVKGEEPGDYFGSRAHATSFGHYGASGTIAWADPKEDLAVVLLTNRAWVSRWPVQERRAARLADAVMSALD